jgi:catechol 2,3-dioxygenase-like lactoylglutathione lyase family enzyme
MPVQRLNHAVLYVRDVERSFAFYRDVLGFRAKVEIPGRAVFLQAEGSTNDHDLGLFAIGAGAGPSQAGRATVGLYHLAWEVDTLAELARIRGALLEAGALVGASDHATTKALYAQDPDGIEFEVSWLLPADLITPDVEAQGATTRPLDLEREIERYGAHTRGGIGVSVGCTPSIPRTHPRRRTTSPAVHRPCPRARGGVRSRSGCRGRPSRRRAARPPSPTGGPSGPHW